MAAMYGGFGPPPDDDGGIFYDNGTDDEVGPSALALNGDLDSETSPVVISPDDVASWRLQLQMLLPQTCPHQPPRFPYRHLV